ncbi:MAG: hypothetical protein KBD24_00415 [Candidatus Pacebacteria bacterium]|nr:hypothetical protein [Candidatus Paceibacterota bacterium]
MKEKIADFLRSRKGQDTALVFAVLLLGTISFGLGRLSKEQERQKPVTLYMPATTSVVAQITTVLEKTTPNVIPAPESSSQKQYVASKSGTVYHLPWCSGAQRIKEENKVWFASKEIAEAAGYRPASNCKGI